MNGPTVAAMQPKHLAVSVNPTAMGYGNTEATRASGESVETAREALHGAGEDTVRPPVKAGEAGGNDQPVPAGMATDVTFTVVYNGSGIISISL